LEEIPGISLSAQAKKKWLSISLTALNSETALEQFLEVLDSYVREVRES